MGENTPQQVTDSEVNVNTTLNNNHPYFLAHSDSPGMTIVNSLFDGRGFPGWRRGVLIALSAKKKLGFINGTCKAPDLNAVDYEQWSCCNDMVISWLLNSLSKDIGDSVIYSKTAKELWDSLEHRFGRSNGAKLYHLQKELSGLVQANSDIAGYYTKLKRLWDELDSLNHTISCTCVCTCEGKARLVKSLEDQKLIQFLMGLNDVYAQARGNILMMNPLPNIDHAYSLLLQDENQREVYVHSTLSAESAAFMTTPQGKFNQKIGNQGMRHSNPMQKFAVNNNQRNGKGALKGKPRKTKYNPNVTCTYCGKTGHVDDNCYRLIGFPDDFEFTKSNFYPNKANGVIAGVETEGVHNSQKEANGSNVIPGNSFAHENNFGQYLNKDQYANLVEQVTRDVQMKQGSTSVSGFNAGAIAGPFNEDHSSFW